MTIDAPVKLTIDPTDPLFLHSSDHPGLTIVTGVFDGRNFGEWKRSVKIALSAKNKYSFVNENLPKPSDDDSRAQIWERCNDMVISWILNDISSEIRSSVIYANTAKKIWEELEVRYGQANGAQMFALQREMNSLVQGSSTISAYFTKLKSLWDEIDSLRKLPPCTCGSAKENLKINEEQKLMQFLMGLNEKYTAARGWFLMIQPLPSVSLAYSMISQDEAQQEFKTQSHMSMDLTSSFIVDAKKGDGTGKKTGLYCTHCKKTNHEIDRCFFIHGFPKKNGKGKKLAAQVNDDTGKSAPAPELTANQYAQLLDLLNVKDQRSREMMAGTKLYSL